MAGGDTESGALYFGAEDAYMGGNIAQAVRILDQAIAAAEDRRILVMLLTQKVGWLRESGHPEQSAQALSGAIRELERLSRAGNELQYGLVRMEQGMAAHRRGDLV